MRLMVELSDYKTGANGFHFITLSRWKAFRYILTVFLLSLVYEGKTFMNV